MYIEPFGVERWLSEYETVVDYNLTSTSIMPLSINKLLEITGEDKDQVKEDIFSLKLSYGVIEGHADYLTGVASLYHSLQKEQIISTNGGVGASYLTMVTVIEPGDHVVAILPAYQQIYSVPESIGAKIDYLFLEKSPSGYVLDMNKLAALVTPKTKAIVFNNPNNPTGDVIADEYLEQMVEIAKENDSYLICDEAYRGLTHNIGFSTSVADLYEKGISLGSMSKAFAMAGVRLGWIATRDETFMQNAHIHRDYTMITTGGIDEYIAALALKHKDVVQQRNMEITQSRATLFKQWLDSEPKLSYVPFKGGTVALPYFDSTLSSEEFCAKVIEEKSVLLMPGFVFGLEKCFRMGYARESEEKMIAGLERISDFLAKLKQ
ncbi:MAG: aminotransferase class I/II-fold pyridoxal phosphate-dependent enzyme [Tetragenococcus koreensis]|nr:aminotransferase class I/II-fold pyridoxal phosphate-dependent enzyme [Tetragenococcus koreensis]MDN6567360.1 aminotransferase class I/II-fold pyridoxal phosphate-dependent enzyme [Tetragenococcus halophilus]MDN6730846.1 aminotransferase class I/II-fold pyridoxal phosphate-dependent enzyme [Atopostipes suicloacalis]MDN6146206.1 aminotransferase class I/II-fold pyridoxal phosphate-dependent enzyme [Tetragenococcus koreensis]MDN6541574.1 aminotransferase class I/II-fold pyridoxal phosphate-dep